jgi:hypothetical protein
LCRTNRLKFAVDQDSTSLKRAFLECHSIQSDASLSSQGLSPEIYKIQDDFPSQRRTVLGSQNLNFNVNVLINGFYPNIQFSKSDQRSKPTHRTECMPQPQLDRSVVEQPCQISFHILGNSPHSFQDMAKHYLPRIASCLYQRASALEELLQFLLDLDFQLHSLQTDRLPMCGKIGLALALVGVGCLMINELKTFGEILNLGSSSNQCLPIQMIKQQDCFGG